MSKIEILIDKAIKNKVINRCWDNAYENPEDEETIKQREKEDFQQKLEEDNIKYGIEDEDRVDSDNLKFLENNAEHIYKEIENILNALKPDIF